MITILGVGLFLFLVFAIFQIAPQAMQEDFDDPGQGISHVFLWILAIGFVLLIVGLAQTDWVYSGTRPVEGAGRAETIIHVR